LAGSGFFGGISKSWSVRRMALMRSDSSGFPGTSAGPESPPERIASEKSSRSPAFFFSGPWHSKQRALRTGRTSFSKKVNASRSGAADKIAGVMSQRLRTVFFIDLDQT